MVFQERELSLQESKKKDELKKTRRSSKPIKTISWDKSISEVMDVLESPPVAEVVPVLVPGTISKVSADSVQVLTCADCGNDWERERKRGRVPKICPDCKNGV